MWILFSLKGREEALRRMSDKAFIEYKSEGDGRNQAEIERAGLGKFA